MGVVNHLGFIDGALYRVKIDDGSNIKLAQFNDHYGDCEPEDDICLCYFSFFGTDYTYRPQRVEVLQRVVTVDAGGLELWKKESST